MGKVPACNAGQLRVGGDWLTFEPAGHQGDRRPKCTEAVEMLGPVLHVFIEDGTKELVLPDAGVEGMDELLDHRLGHTHLQAGRFRVRRHCTPPRSPKLYSGYLLILRCATPLRLREHAQTELNGAEIVEALPALYAAYPPNDLRFHEQFPAVPPYRAAYSGSRCCCFCFDFTVRGQLEGRWR